MNSKKSLNPAVLGVGNALVDIITMLENDAVLEQFGLPRGSMTLVDADLSKNIYNQVISNKKEITTGGSVANSMRTFAGLGGSGGYMGKIGDDELGDLFRKSFEKNGITTHLLYSDKETGRVMGLVSPDSERTMATYLGAAAELTPNDFTPVIFNGYEYLYMEGYLVFNHQLIERGVRLAKEAGLKIAIDLASFNVVEANLEFLKELINSYVDIVFANEEEAKSFTGKDPEEALEEISKMCDIAVVKVGKQGSLIKQGNEVIRVGVIPARAIDTTGAGDNYAAGFLYGLTQNYKLETCGKIAALVSGKVVEVMGPNLLPAQWPVVLKEVEKIAAE